MLGERETQLRSCLELSAFRRAAVHILSTRVALASSRGASLLVRSLLSANSLAALVQGAGQLELHDSGDGCELLLRTPQASRARFRTHGASPHLHRRQSPRSPCLCRPQLNEASYTSATISWEQGGGRTGEDLALLPAGPGSRNGYASLLSL